MEIAQLAKQAGDILLQHRLMLVTAESCTGGGVAHAVTSVPGSSQWFERGLVTYSNLAKQELLGVKEKSLAHYGAVSEEVAIEMAKGALRYSAAHVALAVTGIAGPEGGSKEKPVGTVWFALARDDNTLKSFCECFKGTREDVRKQSIESVLKELLKFLN